MGNSIAAGYRGLETDVPTMYVIANRTEAVCYLANGTSPFQFFERLRSPKGNLKEAQLDSDRPSTGISSAGGGSIRHGMDAGFHQHEHLAKVFARRIAALLELDHEQKKFGDIVLVAEPGFLGVIRAALSPTLKRVVKKEVGHEYNQGSDAEVEALVRNAIETGR